MAGSENYQLNNATSQEPQTNALQMINNLPVVDQEGRYRECRRNYSASMGRYTTDGCGEFLNSGDEGTNDALLCAVCGCHRSFHRKELPSNRLTTQDHLLNNLTSIPIPQLPPPPPPEPSPLLMLPPLAQSDVLIVGEGPPQVTHVKTDVESEAKSGEEIEEEMEEWRRRRRRTKFTEEQKNKMLEFAEKLGWKPQRHDEEEIEKFCRAVGISRRVFKVWLSNNRHKRDSV